MIVNRCGRIGPYAFIVTTRLAVIVGCRPFGTTFRLNSCLKKSQSGAGGDATTDALLEPLLLVVSDKGIHRLEGGECRES